MLTLPKSKDGFVSLCGCRLMECVFMQHGNLVAYASRILKVHEKNCSIKILELEAVAFSLRIQRHYLYRVHVDVFSDQKSLQYVYTQKT